MLILIALVVVLLILNLALVFKLLLCVDELKNGIIRIINRANIIDANIDIINKNIDNIDGSIDAISDFINDMRLFIENYNKDEKEC